MKPFGLIYLITNLVNGKVYVGQTVRGIYSRWSGHKHSARKNAPGSLYSAMRKHGFGAFHIQAIANATNRESLNQLETIWILLLRANECETGYNLSTGGEYPQLTELSRRRMSETRKGRIITPEWRENISKSGKGKKKSEKTKALMSIANKGKKPSLSARLAVARSNKTRVISQLTRDKLSAACRKGNLLRWSRPRKNQMEMFRPNF